MTVTITLHAWWLGAYLLVGLVLLLPCEWAAWRQLYHHDRAPFWRTYWRAVGGRPLRVLVPIVAWPIGLWELVR